MFKLWKSIWAIEKVKKVKKERLEYYLDSTLIIIVLGWNVIWNIARKLYRMKATAMSFYKAFKTFACVKLGVLRDVLYCSVVKVI